MVGIHELCAEIARGPKEAEANPVRCYRHCIAGQNALGNALSAVSRAYPARPPRQQCNIQPPQSAHSQMLLSIAAPNLRGSLMTTPY